MIGDRVVRDGIDYVVVFDGRQPLSNADSGSTLGPGWCGAPVQRGPGRGRGRVTNGWHQMSLRQRLRALRELRGE